MSKIYINPGHYPMIDPGAMSLDGRISEASLCCEIGEILAEILEVRGHTVKLIQSNNLNGESYGPNVIAVANEWQSDIFVSLHCNASAKHTGCGTEIYTSIGVTPADELATTIMEHIMSAFRGRLVLRADWSDGDVDKEAKFAVLRHTVMPAVLLEMCFIDNDADLQVLLAHKERMATAIADGIGDFLEGQIKKDDSKSTSMGLAVGCAFMRHAWE